MAHRVLSVSYRLQLPASYQRAERPDRIEHADFRICVSGLRPRVRGVRHRDPNAGVPELRGGEACEEAIQPGIRGRRNPARGLFTATVWRLRRRWRRMRLQDELTLNVEP